MFDETSFDARVTQPGFEISIARPEQFVYNFIKMVTKNRLSLYSSARFLISVSKGSKHSFMSVIKNYYRKNQTAYSNFIRVVDLNLDQRLELEELGKIMGIKTFFFDEFCLIGTGPDFYITKDILEREASHLTPRQFKKLRRTLRFLSQSEIQITSSYLPQALASYSGSINYHVFSSIDLNTLVHETTHARFEHLSNRLLGPANQVRNALPYLLTGGEQVYLNEFPPLLGYFDELHAWKEGEMFSSAPMSADEIRSHLNMYYQGQIGIENLEIIDNHFTQGHFQGNSVPALLLKSKTNLKKLSSDDYLKMLVDAIEKSDEQKILTILRWLSYAPPYTYSAKLQQKITAALHSTKSPIVRTWVRSLKTPDSDKEKLRLELKEMLKHYNYNFHDYDFLLSDMEKAMIFWAKNKKGPPEQLRKKFLKRYHSFVSSREVRDFVLDYPLLENFMRSILQMPIQEGLPFLKGSLKDIARHFSETIKDTYDVTKLGVEILQVLEKETGRNKKLALTFFKSYMETISAPKFNKEEFIDLSLLEDALIKYLFNNINDDVKRPVINMIKMVFTPSDFPNLFSKVTESLTDPNTPKSFSRVASCFLLPSKNSSLKETKIWSFPIWGQLDGWSTINPQSKKDVLNYLNFFKLKDFLKGQYGRVSIDSEQLASFIKNWATPMMIDPDPSIGIAPAIILAPYEEITNNLNRPLEQALIQTSHGIVKRRIRLFRELKKEKGPRDATSCIRATYSILN